MSNSTALAETYNGYQIVAATKVAAETRNNTNGQVVADETCSEQQNDCLVSSLLLCGPVNHKGLHQC